jgi:molybdenum cofactor cytidylyltransferase
MGRLKQLLPYSGSTLVRHAVRQALNAGFRPVIVVVGARADETRAAVAAEPVEIVDNSSWERGMGSSISAGVAYLKALDTDAAAVAILLADQPLVSAEHLNAMRRLLHSEAASIVAAEYSETLGVPALFRRELFSALISLPPEVGARALIKTPGLTVKAFALPEAACDIDTPGDYAALR